MSVAEAPPGRLDPALIQKTVRADFGEMRKCYAEALRQDASIEGKITIEFVVGLDGHVAAAKDVPSRLPTGAVLHASPAMIDCVLERFRALSFPTPEGGQVTVMYPIVFSTS